MVTGDAQETVEIQRDHRNAVDAVAARDGHFARAQTNEQRCTDRHLLCEKKGVKAWSPFAYLPEQCPWGVICLMHKTSNGIFNPESYNALLDRGMPVP